MANVQSTKCCEASIRTLPRFSSDDQFLTPYFLRLYTFVAARTDILRYVFHSPTYTVLAMCRHAESSKRLKILYLPREIYPEDKTSQDIGKSIAKMSFSGSEFKNTSEHRRERRFSTTKEPTESGMYATSFTAPFEARDKYLRDDYGMPFSCIRTSQASVEAHELLSLRDIQLGVTMSRKCCSYFLRLTIN